jgi:hypothetical protein
MMGRNIKKKRAMPEAFPKKPMDGTGKTAESRARQRLGRLLKGKSLRAA